MLSKQFRLRTKDVKFLTKKRNYLSSGFFGFFYIKQYDNLRFNQFSFHIPLKYSKKAVHRNQIRRCLYNYYRIKGLSDKKIGNNYYKVFVILQKNRIDELKKQIEKMSEKDILNFVYSIFDQSLLNLTKMLSK